MKNINNIFMRMLAVFAASGLSVIGAGSLFGISALTAALIAGTLGVATVVENLARSFLDDGKLTSAEINEAFSKVDKKKP
jgi:archaellum component FlaG (FlaF/FlaG flagellin family)